MDVETNGDIFGLSPGDSKLVGLDITLRSVLGKIQVRKIRAETCALSAIKGISVASALEAAVLSVNSHGGFEVRKRMGVGAGPSRLTSTGGITIGSLFSAMAEMPPPVFDNDLSIEHFMQM